MKITLVIGPNDGAAFNKLVAVLQAVLPGFLPTPDQAPAETIAELPPSSIPRSLADIAAYRQRKETS
jgi:hypothetical protein